MSPSSVLLEQREMTLRAAAIVFGAISLCIGCKDAELRPKHYPAGVPSYAVWAGGADGGAYISCTVEPPRNLNYCRVWNDFGGELIESGDYQFLVQHRLARQSELKYLGADFDGEIYLQNGLTLKKLN
jgi:hypothetical protein